MQNGKLIALVMGGSLLVVVAAAVVFSRNAQTQTQPKPVDQTRLVREDSHHTASDSAQVKVTVVEFADFQCPTCAEVVPAVEKLQQEYGKRVNWVYRHFPLNQHKNAMISAEAGEAAHAQGKFWEMGRKLYSTQDEWEDSNNPLEKFLGYAKELGLDEAKFRAFVEKKQAENKIKRDQSDGFIVGVVATPTFFVNGYKIADWDEASLRAQIEEALGKSD